MAGGKETPRQKMIGMMYLVLTALLALNISKEIVMAFVKLNDKMEESNRILDTKVDESFTKFENAMALPQTKASAKPWYERAEKVKKLADTEVDYLLKEASDLIKEVEGKDWIETDPKTKKKKLIALNEIQSKDDYDAATRLFVGGDPKSPIERGVQIRTHLHKLRDEMCKILGTYQEGKKSYSFDPAKIKDYDRTKPESVKALKEALKTANPADTSKISQIYKTLSYPAELTEYDEPTSWQGGMFDHAPVVAAAALFTSLRGDIKAAEVIALDHLTTKLEQPIIKINKIEPMAFARAGYLNQGDSMTLKVMIAAYDSTDVPLIRYSEDGAAEKEVKGGIAIRATNPGEREIKGTIGIKQKGELVWKPWAFKYEVGKPSAVVSHTELNVLYAGYNNKMSATASGYPNEKVRLNAGGLSANKQGDVYIVNPPPNMAGREVQLSVSADGKNLGSFKYKIRPLPKPSSFFGSIPGTESFISKSQIASNAGAGIRVAYDESIPLSVAFATKKFDMVVTVNGNTVTKSATGGRLTPEMMTLLNQLRPGASVSFTGIRTSSPSGTEIRVNPLSFIIK